MTKCYFAKLNESNVVIDMIIVGGDIPTAEGPLSDNPMHIDGENWCNNNVSTGTWKQCFEDKSFRGNFPGILEFYYDLVNDKFIMNKPYDNWILNTTTWIWECPITNRPTKNSYSAIEGKNLYPATWNPNTQRLEATNNLDLTEETIYYWDDTNSTFTN